MDVKKAIALKRAQYQEGQRIAETMYYDGADAQGNVSRPHIDLIRTVLPEGSYALKRGYIVRLYQLLGCDTKSEFNIPV